MFDRDGASVILRELANEYANANATYFGEKLKPIPLGLSDDSSRLGCFIRDPRRIELARTLVYERPWGSVIEVLKHEMAHQFVAEVLGQWGESSHGPTFRTLCERLGIDASATGLPEVKAGEARVFDRIRKLFALGESSNRNEAEAAMRMAHRLMLKHNLDYGSHAAAPSDFGFRHLGRPTGRISEAEGLLAGLLGEFFFVHPIWVSVFRVEDRKRVSVLEVTGRHDNLAMAEYVYEFLQRSADRLWRDHKRKHQIQRNADRRAFLAGVMRGFGDKLRSERSAAQSTGLVWVSDPQADSHFRSRHPRVRNTTYTSSAGSDASTHGHAAGRELVMNRPLSEANGKPTRALPSGG